VARHEVVGMGCRLMRKSQEGSPIVLYGPVCNVETAYHDIWHVLIKTKITGHEHLVLPINNSHENKDTVESLKEDIGKVTKSSKRFELYKNDDMLLNTRSLAS